MCQCKNVEFGSYEAVFPLWYDNRKKVVGVDACIALEVVGLWEIGVITLESCCGHNKDRGYIAVDEVCIPKMIELGYQEDIGHIGCFLPKTTE